VLGVHRPLDRHSGSGRTQGLCQYLTAEHARGPRVHVVGDEHILTDKTWREYLQQLVEHEVNPL